MRWPPIASKPQVVKIESVKVVIVKNTEKVIVVTTKNKKHAGKQRKSRILARAGRNSKNKL